MFGGTGDLHDPAAAYALDALDDRERAEFEEHLGSCEDCQDEVRSFTAAAAALALAAAPVAPPAELRSQLLEAARRERANVIPLRRRRAATAAPAVAVAASTALVAVGVWASSLRHSLARERAAVAVFADPDARHIPLAGAHGALVVARDGRAALAVALPPPPAHKRYEAWVMSPKPHRAALFSTRAPKLDLRVHRGDVVAVTLERAEGVDAPTSRPLLTARA